MLTDEMREDLVALIAATEAMQQMKAAVILAKAILQLDGPPTTASPTKAEPSVVDSQPQTAPMETDAITQRIPLSQRLRGALTAAERTHVVRCCECQERLDLFWSQLWTHVPAVGGIEPQEATPSTSVKRGTTPFAEPSSMTTPTPAESPSNASSESQAASEPWQIEDETWVVHKETQIGFRAYSQMSAGNLCAYLNGVERSGSLAAIEKVKEGQP